MESRRDARSWPRSAHLAGEAEDVLDELAGRGTVEGVEDIPSAALPPDQARVTQTAQMVVKR